MSFTNIFIHKGCNKSLLNDTIKQNGAGRIKFKARGIEQQSFILQALEGIHAQTILLLGFGVGPHWSQHAFDDDEFLLLQKQNCDQVASLIELSVKNRLHVICVNPMKNKHPVKSFEDIRAFGCETLLSVAEKTFCIGQYVKEVCSIDMNVAA